jgi:hypothetical protein
MIDVVLNEARSPDIAVDWELKFKAKGWSTRLKQKRYGERHTKRGA